MNKPFLLTLEYPPQHGGVGKYLENEVNNSLEPVIIKVVSGSNWMSLLWQARRDFHGCDYLWISHVLPIGYIALVWKCFYKTPYRVYLHGLDLVLPLKSRWKKFWVKIILNNADEIIVNSQATKKLLDNYNIRRDAICRVSVQYPRIEKIDITKYKPIGDKLRQKYNIENKPILLTISRLVKRKGIDLVIKSLPAVWRQIPDLVYVVVGEGEERSNLENTKKDVTLEQRSPQATEAIGSSIFEMDSIGRLPSPEATADSLQNDKIIFTGAVSDEEKYGWLSACNCFILTPIDDPNDFEGYGIVYKEAQMFNKPVIGSLTGGVSEAVEDNGVLVEPGNIEQITDAIIRYVQP